MYQHTLLSDLSAIGAPGSLPDVIATWGGAPDLLADLTGHVDTQFGFDGTGFWPIVETIPSFEATKQILAGTVTLGKVDATAHTWSATADVRDLTAEEIAAANPVPDNPTLGDWRVGLTLWGRMDDVTAKVAALVTSSNPSQAILGKIATERLEYSNNVLRAQLLQLRDVFGFTAADVDESLWRAHQVSLGDLSDKWPLDSVTS